MALLTQKPERSEPSELLTKEPFLAIKKEIQKELGPQLMSRFRALLEKSREKKERDDDDKVDLTVTL